MITECYSKNGCPCVKCGKACCIKPGGGLTDTEKLCDEARVHCERCAEQHRLQELEDSFERIARASRMGSVMNCDAILKMGVRTLQENIQVIVAENSLATVAGFEYVESIKPVLLGLVYSRPEPGNALYKSYLHEVTMLIMSGMEPGDVLSSYEAKLAKMKGGKV